MRDGWGWTYRVREGALGTRWLGMRGAGAVGRGGGGAAYVCLWKSVIVVWTCTERKRSDKHIHDVGEIDALWER